MCQNKDSKNNSAKIIICYLLKDESKRIFLAKDKDKSYTVWRKLADAKSDFVGGEVLGVEWDRKVSPPKMYLVVRVKNWDQVKLPPGEWHTRSEWQNKKLDKITARIFNQDKYFVPSEWEERYKRALADYQNLNKQTAKEKAEWSKYALEQFLHNLLPVFDNLKLAFEHLDDQSGKNWLQGIQYIIKQFREVLTQAGVREIETEGKKFDYTKMEAVDRLPTQDKSKADLVAKQLKAGYCLQDKVIVPARVVVFEYQKDSRQAQEGGENKD